MHIRIHIHIRTLTQERDRKKKLAMSLRKGNPLLANQTFAAVVQVVRQVFLEHV